LPTRIIQGRKKNPRVTERLKNASAREQAGVSEILLYVRVRGLVFFLFLSSSFAMKRACRTALLRHVQQLSLALNVTAIDLFEDCQVHVVVDWEREYGSTRIRLLQTTTQGRVELSVTKDPRGVARDAIVTSFLPRDSHGRKHGWHNTWYSYHLHCIHS
jgi:hypothetical protein